MNLGKDTGLNLLPQGCKQRTYEECETKKTNDKKCYQGTYYTFECKGISADCSLQKTRDKCVKTFHNNKACTWKRTGHEEKNATVNVQDAFTFKDISLATLKDPNLKIDIISPKKYWKKEGSIFYCI